MAEFDQLTGLDCAFLFMESAETPMHVGGVYLFGQDPDADAPFSLDDLKAFLAPRLHLAKPFLKKIVRLPFDLDYPYWIDDRGFDPDRHIVSLTTEPVDGWPQFCQSLARFFREPVVLDAAPWLFGLIPDVRGLEAVPEGGFALLTKVHHAAIDGASGVDIQRALFALEPGASPPPATTERRVVEEPGLAAKLAQAQSNAIMAPMKLLSSYATLGARFTELAQAASSGTVQLPPTNPPKTRFNANIDTTRVFGAASFAMEDIKRLRAGLNGITVNDAVLAIVGGAMRAYLEDKGEEIDAPLYAMVPISVRKQRDAQSTGNDVANMSVSIGSHLADPLQRLMHVHEAADKAKAVIARIGAESISEASKHTPPWLASQMLQGFSRFGAGPAGTIGSNTTVTNVPGPPMPVFMGNAPLKRQYNLAPLMHGMGLVHTIYSYCGTVTAAFNACETMLPDPQFYEQCLSDSAENLFALTQSSKA